MEPHTEPMSPDSNSHQENSGFKLAVMKRLSVARSQKQNQSFNSTSSQSAFKQTDEWESERVTLMDMVSKSQQLTNITQQEALYDKKQLLDAMLRQKQEIAYLKQELKVLRDEKIGEKARFKKLEKLQQDREEKFKEQLDGLLKQINQQQQELSRLMSERVELVGQVEGSRQETLQTCHSLQQQLKFYRSVVNKRKGIGSDQNDIESVIMKLNDQDETYLNSLRALLGNMQETIQISKDYLIQPEVFEQTLENLHEKITEIQTQAAQSRKIWATELKELIDMYKTIGVGNYELFEELKQENALLRSCLEEKEQELYIMQSYVEKNSPDLLKLAQKKTELVALIQQTEELQSQYEIEAQEEIHRLHAENTELRDKIQQDPNDQINIIKNELVLAEGELSHAKRNLMEYIENIKKLEKIIESNGSDQIEEKSQIEIHRLYEELHSLSDIRLKQEEYYKGELEALYQKLAKQDETIYHLQKAFDQLKQGKLKSKLEEMKAVRIRKKAFKGIKSYIKTQSDLQVKNAMSQHTRPKALHGVMEMLENIVNVLERKREVVERRLKGEGEQIEKLGETVLVFQDQVAKFQGYSGAVQELVGKLQEYFGTLSSLAKWKSPMVNFKNQLASLYIAKNTKSQSLNSPMPRKSFIYSP